ncbi:hypothetical protein BBFL7_02105 [Flavobacteria bacterium BBFL7]|nr:hypothetical protein BBFL7_02105 [Flavobacteria bacterium BBFL7]
MLKINVVNKCEEVIQGSINRYKERVQELSDSLADNDASNDAEDDDGSGELMADFERYNNLKDEHEKLKRAFENISYGSGKTAVTEGALVSTDTNVFLISVSLGELTTDEGDKCFVISSNAPIYEAMKGLTTGDSFTFNGVTRRIIQIN